ncbi:MAG: hypothetical protein IJY47_07645 [Clostridia bacterium]|nr:hypothetical protein [Clostridia bacterium]
MKNIVNIINFVRGLEPREGRNIDLQKPIREQIRVMRENGLRGTFLLQYDALISKDFQALMEECRDFCEIGLWLEIVEPLVTRIGEEWKGRYPWDWYCDVGFLIGYAPEVRIRLVDEAMSKFKEVFGRYPDSVGSWHIDAVSMRHLSETYGVRACCICRDQVGTDGYTMQGGYYNQAYYPSVNNMFCPASTEENQIDMPVFRMLGSDPIYAYDHQVFGYGFRHCPTLEPGQLGRNAEWCDWFFGELFGGSGLCFQYTQAGQENSFGWEKMGEGIEYQFPRIAEMEREGKVQVMTLGEAGAWYRDTYSVTPAATIAAASAWEKPDCQSIWYYSRFYRINLLMDGGVLRVRDMYLFNEKYPSHYLTKRCDSHACEFRNLPVMDGVIYSNPAKGITAGVYLTRDGEPIRWDDMRYEETAPDQAVITLTARCGEVKIILSESEVLLRTNAEKLRLCPVYDKERVFGTSRFGDETFANHNNRKTNLTFITRARAEQGTIGFTFDGFDYSLAVREGEIGEDLSLTPVSGMIRIQF